MIDTEEIFRREVAKSNHKYLKIRHLMPLMLADPKTKQVSWLLYIGLLETWIIISR